MSTQQVHRVTPLSGRIVAALLGIVFVSSGGVKATDVDAFAVNVGEYGIVPDSLVRATAITIVLIEVATGVALFVIPRLGARVATILLLVFVAVLGYGMARGLDIDCGCLPFGIRESLTAAIVRDGVMIAAASFVLYSTRRCNPRRRNPSCTPSSGTNR
ncbi:MAG: DoxX family protein [Planctomycetes bacterium]|nr:DoxX family protein [Planctomycetota bacterium]